MNPRRAAYSLLSLALTIGPVGCSHKLDDRPRVAVAGTVTMDGQPLPEAVITFSPAGTASNDATAVTWEINDGAFSIPREDGPVPGSYKVSISHAEMKGVEAKGKGRNKKVTLERSKVIGPEKIPARYNTATELKADIPSGGVSNLKYELQSK